MPPAKKQKPGVGSSAATQEHDVQEELSAMPHKNDKNSGGNGKNDDKNDQSDKSDDTQGLKKRDVRCFSSRYDNTDTLTENR
jgi:hypothetical protein